MAAYMRITISSHYFRVDRLNHVAKNACFIYSNQMVQWGFKPERGRMVRVKTKVYAASNKNNTEFRFHINCLNEFLETTKRVNIHPNFIQMEKEAPFEAKDIEIEMKKGWVMRDYQIPLSEFCTNGKPVSKLLSLQTGQGKGATAMQALVNKKKRFLVIVKPMFIQKWVDDLIKTTNLKREDILTVRGSEEMKALLVKGKEDDFDFKCAIISNTTVQNWIKEYEFFGNGTLEMGWDCLPHDLHRHLKSGERLIDEVHMHFHLCFKMDLYTHVHSSISLSATLFNADPFLSRMYRVMFPPENRTKELALKKYIDVIAVYYEFENPDLIRTMERGMTTFSNNAYEESIIRNKTMLKNYLEMIADIVKKGYDQVNRLKKVAVVYAYTTEMVDLLLAYLKKVFPDYRIKRKVSGDLDENIYTCDLCLSTLGSLGTAIDIPNLTNVIMSNMVASEQANVQTMGRLRELEDGHPVVMHYFVASNIEKTLDYHQKKIELFTPRARSQSVYLSGRKI